LNLKVLALILFYYGMLSAFFVIGAGSIPVDATLTGNLTNMSGSLTGDETPTGGLFSIGVSFLRFAGFVLIGVGLPSDTPAAVSTVFFLWQTCVTIFVIGFFISSIWDG